MSYEKKHTYSYIQPEINVSVKLFLLDSSGKYTKWDDIMLANSDYWGERVDYQIYDNDLALVISDDDTDTCRETVCNSFSDFILKMSLPLGHSITLKPPGRVKDTSEFTTIVYGSTDGSPGCGMSVEDGDPLYIRGFELVSSKKNLADMYALTDVIMGTAALLLGGPGAYTRTKGDSNNLRAYREGNEMSIGYYDRRHLRFVDEGSLESEVSTELSYDGVSNFWMVHPATLSIMLGLNRFSLELWLDDKFKEIDEDIGIDATRNWLAKTTKKKTLTKKDKAELLEVMSWFKAYFSSDKVAKNPGAYPIHKWNWEMFVRFTKMDFSEYNFYGTWKAQGDIYGLCSYGFHTWCVKQKKKTTNFVSRPKAANWGGLAGNMVPFRV